jgi:hypothetical protein
MRWTAVIVVGVVCALAPVGPAGPAWAQEPTPQQPPPQQKWPPETVPDMLVAMKRDGRGFLDAMLASQFKVDPAMFPGIAGWVGDLKKVQATWADKEPAAITVDVEALTTNNPKFWAACLETYPGDPMLLNVVTALRMIGGEGYRAMHTITLAGVSPGRPPVLATTTRRFNAFCSHLFTLSAAEIRKGIALHDAADYDGALKAYRAHLEAWPQDGWAHYELGQTMMVQGMKAGTLDMTNPKSPHQAEYALCRRYQPLQVNAWQGMDPAVIMGALTIRTDVVPAWQAVQRGRAGAAELTKLTEGAQKLGLHDLALLARGTLAAINQGYTQADRDFIAKGLRALVPGEATEAVIARLNGEKPPMFMLARFEGEPPAFKWKKE